MTVVSRIARDEVRFLWRSRVAVLGIVLLVLLTLVAALTAYQRQHMIGIERAGYQAQANAAFDAQPNRHPHRMVHYGHFVFRPISPLAAFDPGIESFTGHTLFLEGHRQNTANFGDVRQSSMLVRFGQLTPAFVLQMLAPLLLIFLGYAMIARERERGTLKVLLAQGVGVRALILGKLLAIVLVEMLVFLPALVALLLIGTTGVGGLVAGYALWLAIWALVIVLVSASSRRSRDALLALFAIWAVSVILVPRIAPDVATDAVRLATRFETDIAIQRDLSAMGDSHNPNDPYFAEFKKTVLAKYGVTRVEDLPVNYKGVLGMEGERMTSALFDRYATHGFDAQERQNGIVGLFSAISPVVALRTLSMTLAGTDLISNRRFLEQAEHYRFNLIQSLNRMQAEKVAYKNDTNPNLENRIDRKNWQNYPSFTFVSEDRQATMKRVWPSLGVLALWLALLTALIVPVSRQLGRSAT
ncbi:MAG: DUF3526 domain-containing protein [Sphingomonadales bacterium]